MACQWSGVAINTALQASAGKTTPADVVQLAEDVKEVASKFKGVAKVYQDLTREIRASLTNIEVGLGDMLAGGNSYEASAIGHVSDRVGRWVERSVLIAEKMRALVRVESLKSPADSSTDGFQRSESPFDAARQRPAVETESTAPSALVSEDGSSDAATGGEEQFVTLDESAPILDETSKTAAPALEGLQNEERGIFDEMSTQDEMFAELGADEKKPGAQTDGVTPQEDDGGESGEGVTGVESEQADAAWEAAKEGAWEEPESQATEDDVSAEAPSTPAAGAAPEAIDPVATADQDTGDSDSFESNVYDIDTDGEPAVDEILDNDVINLYALGAVDYDPAVHQ